MPRNQSKRDGKIVRAAKALELRQQGLTFDEIAKDLGVSIRTAWLDVTRQVQARAKEAEGRSAEMRAEMLADVERSRLALLPKVDAGDRDAIATLMVVHQRWAKLYALDLEADRGPEGPQVIVVDARTPAERTPPPVIDGRETPELPPPAEG